MNQWTLFICAVTKPKSATHQQPPPLFSLRHILIHFFLKNPLSDLPVCSNPFSHPWGTYWGLLEWISKHQRNHRLRWVAFLSSLLCTPRPLSTPDQQPCSASFEPTSSPRMICAAKKSLASHFVGVWMPWRSSVFISRPVTAERQSVSLRRSAGTVGGVTETDRRWGGDGSCHRLPRLPAGGLRRTICFSSQQIIFLINL